MASNFLEILTQLHDNRVDFVIVGGVAAALHGGTRVTFDLDVVPSLTPDSWMAAVDLLWSLGARPRIPEPLERIRDVEQIRRWQEEKGMLALNFRTPDGSTEVDLLVSHCRPLVSILTNRVSTTGERYGIFFLEVLQESLEKIRRRLLFGCRLLLRRLLLFWSRSCFFCLGRLRRGPSAQNTFEKTYTQFARKFLATGKPRIPENPVLGGSISRQ